MEPKRGAKFLWWGKKKEKKSLLALVFVGKWRPFRPQQHTGVTHKVVNGDQQLGKGLEQLTVCKAVERQERARLALLAVGLPRGALALAGSLLGSPRQYQHHGPGTGKKQSGNWKRGSKNELSGKHIS